MSDTEDMQCTTGALPMVPEVGERRGRPCSSFAERNDNGNVIVIPRNVIPAGWELHDKSHRKISADHCLWRSTVPGNTVESHAVSLVSC